METSVGNLAGFFAAHGIWCVSEGSVLIPMVGFVGGDGQQGMNRFVTDDAQEGVDMGRKWIAETEGIAMSALVFDGLITLESGKIDALILEIRDDPTELLMAVPYRNASSPAGFAVHKPKVLEFSGESDELDAIIDGFFEGVNSHTEGAAIWNASLDQSV